MQDNGFSNVKSYNWYKGSNGPKKWSSNKTGVTEKELFDAVTRTTDDLFDYVYVRYIFSTYNCMTALKITLNCRFLKADPTTRQFNFKTYDIAKTHLEWITEQRHRSFGKCYTFYPDEKTR